MLAITLFFNVTLAIQHYVGRFTFDCWVLRGPLPACVMTLHQALSFSFVYQGFKLHFGSWKTACYVHLVRGCRLLKNPPPFFDTASTSLNDCSVRVIQLAFPWQNFYHTIVILDWKQFTFRNLIFFFQHFKKFSSINNFLLCVWYSLALLSIIHSDTNNGCWDEVTNY